MTMLTATRNQPAVSLAPPALPGSLTYEEFLAWESGENHVEWVDGKVVFMSPVSREHATVSQFLQQLISCFVAIRRMGEVYADPFQMKTGPRLPGRAPDLLFVTNENLGRLKPNHLDGPADLVVEVISPESRGRDRGEKFYEYEEGGVREYWLIDPTRMKAEFFRRGDDGYFHPLALGANERFESALLPGLWLQLDWLWQRPPPTLPQILKEWGMA